MTLTLTQALRVPFESFAGRDRDHLGNPNKRTSYRSPLHMIVAAAERTEDYRVFGSPLVEILIDWKWQNFVRAAFLKELFFYTLHLVMVLLWNVEVIFWRLQAAAQSGTLSLPLFSVSPSLFVSPFRSPSLLLSSCPPLLAHPSAPLVPSSPCPPPLVTHRRMEGLQHRNGYVYIYIYIYIYIWHIHMAGLQHRNGATEVHPRQ